MRSKIALNIIIITLLIYCVRCSNGREKLKNNSFLISSEESQIFKRVSGKDFNKSTGDEIKIALKDVELAELRQRIGQVYYNDKVILHNGKWLKVSRTGFKLLCAL